MTFDDILKNMEEIRKNIDAVDELISKHFSLDNDERHGSPWNWNIGDTHDELDEEQLNHGIPVGDRRMATALRALARKRGKNSIPKWVELMSMSSQELNALGEKEFGSEWQNAIQAVSGGTANNMDVKDVPDEALATESDGPVDPQAAEARTKLKDLARRLNLGVKEVEALSDSDVLKIARKMGL